MYLGLVYYPDIKLDGFNVLRNQYDPYASLMPVHLPFIFPVDESIGRTRFQAHVQNILCTICAFTVHLCKLEKSPDHWLFLTPQEGEGDAIRLHDLLYTGIMSPYLRKDLPYRPHVALGHFGKTAWDLENPAGKIELDELAYNKALSECARIELDFWKTIDRLSIVRLNKELTSCENLDEIPLGI